MKSYPDDETLRTIREWPWDDFGGLMKFIRKHWTYADWGWREYEPGVYEISTGGWSGNEDIIQAMMQNAAVWVVHWYLSRRGGHYVFARPGAKLPCVCLPD